MAKTHEPFRCFDGTHQPYEPFWTWNVVEGADPELEFNGYISEYSWWEDEITPKKFKDDLYRIGAGGPVTLRMHSYGGDVVAASLINAIIRDYPGQVTVQIDGVAASAATVVAVAGDVVKMQETAYFMIHDPMAVFFMAALNIQELTRLTDSLQAIKDGIVNAYETKTGLSRARLSKMMTAETWMDAQRAADLGFVDEVVRPGRPLAVSLPEHTAVANALRDYKNVPPELLVISEAAVPSEPPLSEDEEREALRLRREVQSIKERKN